MRSKAPLILAVLAIVLALAGLAEAGLYHLAAQLACQDCHLMHAQQQHSLTGSTVGYPITINGGAGVPFLLRATSAVALCTACHDGQTTAPDVVGIDFNSAANSGVGGRSAGALNNFGNAAAPYQDWKGHSLGFAGTAPGTGATNFASFKCTNCHDQHGNTNYRNLRAKDDTGTALGTTTISNVLSTTGSTNTANVRINLAAYTVPASTGNPAPATRAPYYGTNNIFHHEPPANLEGYTTFCVNCHVGFITGNKHPSNTGDNVGGTNLTNYNVANWATLAKVKVTSPDYTANTGPTAASPVCATCHKGHGNDNAFGLIFMNRANLVGTVNEQGSTGGTENDLCSQCHTQAN